MTDVAQREKEARAFLEETLKEPMNGDLHELLKNGQVLCRFINILKPGSVAKINTGKMPFFCMENIGSYITACKALGLPDQYNFMTVDLWENKNMGQVYLNLTSLKRHLGLGFEKAAGPSEKQLHVLQDCVVPEQPREVALPAQPKAVAPPVSPRTGAGYEAGHAPSRSEICAVCNLPISTGTMNACNKYYHTKCFNCKKCGAKLATGKFYEHNKHPHCEKCIYLLKPVGKH